MTGATLTRARACGYDRAMVSEQSKKFGAMLRREIEEEILGDGPLTWSVEFTRGVARMSRRRAVKEAWKRREATLRPELREVATIKAPPR